MNKYYAARKIIKRKLINDNKISYINTKLEEMRLLIDANRDTFGWINTDNIAKLFDIPLQTGILKTKVNEEIENIIEEIHDRNSFYSCLR